MDPLFLYPAMSAKLVMNKRMEVISNNIANADTVGFKRSYPVFGSVVPAFAKINAPQGSRDGTGGVSRLPIPSFAILAESATDFTKGKIKTTNVGLDVAIEGNGFFQIQTPFGIQYTRNGSFELSAEGTLVTQSGHPVLGIGGSMTLPPGIVSIDPTGKISVRENKAAVSTEVDTLALVDIPDPSRLEKVGDDLFRLVSGEAAPIEEGGAQVRQGALETSNVDPVQEMIAMIFALRQYEAAQKAIFTAEEMSASNVNKVGQLRT